MTEEHGVRPANKMNPADCQKRNLFCLLKNARLLATADSRRYSCRVGQVREIFFLWRPFLKDPLDDMILEVAAESECDFIVTHNIKDFAGVDQFGLEVLRPAAFLRRLEEAP